MLAVFNNTVLRPDHFVMPQWLPGAPGGTCVCSRRRTSRLGSILQEAMADGIDTGDRSLRFSLHWIVKCVKPLRPLSFCTLSITSYSSL